MHTHTHNPCVCVFVCLFVVLHVCVSTYIYIYTCTRHIPSPELLACACSYLEVLSALPTPARRAPGGQRTEAGFRTKIVRNGDDGEESLVEPKL